MLRDEWAVEVKILPGGEAQACGPRRKNESKAGEDAVILQEAPALLDALELLAGRTSWNEDEQAWDLAMTRDEMAECRAVLARVKAQK